MGLLKIGGLSSGLDTEGLITTLMSIEKRPLTNMTKQRDTLTTQANAWRDLNSRLLTLKKRFDELQGLSESSWLARKSVAGDTNIVSVSATSNTATLGTHSVEVVSLAKATVWQAGLMAGGAVADPEADLTISGTIRVNNGTATPPTFTVNAGDSLNDIAKTINDNSETLGVTASVVQVNPGDYRLVLTGKTGAANHFVLEDDGGTAAQDLRLTAADGGVEVQTAVDGVAKVAGISVTTADNVLKDAIAGITMTMGKVGTTSVTVSKDQARVVDAVKKVIDQYNSVMDFIDTQTSYDAKTKQAGTLFGEQRVNDIQEAMRNKLFNLVAGQPDEFASLGVVGIRSEGFRAGEKASKRLSFDQDKFTKALEKDPLALRALFVRTPGSTETNTDANTGVAGRLAAYLDNYTRTDGILAGQTKALEKGVELIKQRITRFETQTLPAKEKQLRAQFIALEKAMSTMQAQGNWLSAQIKSMVPAQQ